MNFTSRPILTYPSFLADTHPYRVNFEIPKYFAASSIVKRLFMACQTALSFMLDAFGQVSLDPSAYLSAMALMRGSRIYHHTEKVGGKDVTLWNELCVGYAPVPGATYAPSCHSGFAPFDAPRRR